MYIYIYMYWWERERKKKDGPPVRHTHIRGGCRVSGVVWLGRGHMALQSSVTRSIPSIHTLLLLLLLLFWPVSLTIYTGFYQIDVIKWWYIFSSHRVSLSLLHRKKERKDIYSLRQDRTAVKQTERWCAHRRNNAVRGGQIVRHRSSTRGYTQLSAGEREEVSLSE